MKFTALKKLNDVVMKFFTWVTIVFGTTMTCLVFLNVVMRYVFHASIPWSEEAARFLFIWVTFLGAILANDKCEHMRLDFVVTLFPKKAQKIIGFLVNMVIVAFLAILIHGACRYTVNQWDWKSSALHIRHGLVYSIAPVSFSILAIQFFCRGVNELLTMNKEDESAAAKEEEV